MQEFSAIEGFTRAREKTFRQKKAVDIDGFRSFRSLGIDAA
jgi:hypothetical protein